MIGGWHTQGLIVWAADASSSSTPSTTALVGLGGALAGALIAGGFRLAGDRVARRAEAQRAALYALQESALALRKALRAYGEAAPRPSKKIEDRLDEANGTFEVQVQRILCEQVRHWAAAWLAVAQPYWTGDDEVILAEEDAAWRLLQHHVGAELRHLDS